jgi:hypothetical protein
LIVITAYCVCEANISTIGASTAYHQQWHLIRHKGDPNPQPRKQLITDLITEIQKWQRSGADIILGGDFNEKLGDSPEGLARLITKCELVDPHAANHGTAQEPSTYSRGTKRLDYVFISPRVLPFIQHCGIDPFHQIIFTDHRGMFLDVDIKGLLGGEMAQIQTPQIRGVSSNMDKPETYIWALHAHLMKNNVFSNSAPIFEAAKYFDQLPPRMVTKINKFDGTITQGVSLAEKKCRLQPRPAWSVPLADASRTVKYWKIHIGGIQTKKDVSETLNKIGKDLKWDQLPQTNSMEDAKRELQQAQKDLNKCRKEATDLRKAFLDEKIEAAAIAEDTTSEKLLKKLRHREAQPA